MARADRGPYINTIRGTPFYFRMPHMSVIEPEDIAWALAHLCRYTGHVREFYSVAQHCVIVSQNVDKSLALQGLLHDASEAYTGDINHPLKVILKEGGTFAHIEAEIERAIAVRFGVQWPWHKEVKRADLRTYATEIRDISPLADGWADGSHEPSEPYLEKIYPWGPHTARREWMNRFVELGGVR